MAFEPTGAQGATTAYFKSGDWAMKPACRVKGETMVRELNQTKQGEPFPFEANETVYAGSGDGLKRAGIRNPARLPRQLTTH
jgi:hypothetical protein